MAVVATGFFDGVHLGHRAVIQTLVSSARQRGEEAIAVTFAQHPRAVLQQDARILRLLNSPQEKEALLRSLGVDRVETLPFDRSFAQLSAADYIRTVLRDRLGATLLVLGYDNRLGSDCLTPDLIRPLAESLGLEVLVVPPTIASAPEAETAAAAENRSHPRLRKREGPAGQCADGDELARERQSLDSGRGPAQPDVFCGWLPQSDEKAEVISSTKIRKSLEEGRVEDAEAMLGYPYGLRGVVVSGKQLGRTIGFPTANLRLYDPLKLIPACGVYLTEVDVLGRHLWGMTNVAEPIETHIFDFNEDIYGLDIEIRFRRWLRPMRAMEGLDDLKNQLAVDQTICRELIGADC